MGMSVSKRVDRLLASSPEMAAACDAAYDTCLDLAQHAFPGILLYQLPDAAARVHAALLASSSSLPIIRRWVPDAPGQSQVDSALARSGLAGEPHLSRPQFRAFAVELLRDAVVSAAGRAVVARAVPAGVAGVAGVGVVGRAGVGVLGAAVAVYAAGAAASVYIGMFW